MYCSRRCQTKDWKYHKLICSPTVPEMIVKRMKMEKVRSPGQIWSRNIYLSSKSIHHFFERNSFGYLTIGQYGSLILDDFCIECYKPITYRGPMKNYMLEFKNSEGFKFTMYRCIPCHQRGNKICSLHIQTPDKCPSTTKKETLNIFYTLLCCLNDCKIYLPKDILKIIRGMMVDVVRCDFIEH
jgi:hypothetical protein